ncbi:MAG: alpha-2-macroglobulin family protein [Candidatus Marinimicrobia bacterium]|nr:alpha-2-macroglobulin family protein [Candidatus Neomarinimicrobiota bacterium]
MHILRFIRRLIKTVFGTITYEPPAFWNQNREKPSTTRVETKETTTKTQITKQEQLEGLEGSEKGSNEKQDGEKKLGVERSDSEKTGGINSESGRKRSERPTIPRAVKIILPILLVGIGAVMVWQSTIPEPKKIKVTFSTPRPMALKNNAAPSKLTLRFNGSAARLEDVQKIVTSGVEIDPEIAGEWKWEKDTRLTFQPTVDWKPDIRYTIKLAKELFPPHVLLNLYKPAFTTAPFTFKIVSSKFHIDPVNQDLKQVSATVRFSHPVDPESFEKKVKLRPQKLDRSIQSFSDRDYDLNITYDDYFGKAYILSESLPMPEDDLSMNLSVSEGVACRSGQRSQNTPTSNITIPGITTFIKIRSASQSMVRNDDYKLEQILVVDSKGKAKAEDLIKYTEAWILPKDLPATPGVRAQRNYGWQNTSLVGPEVLALAKPVRLEEMEAELEYSELNSFKIKAEPGRHLYVRIKKGAPFYGKYNLSKDFDSVLRVKSYPKQLEIMHDGVVLSSNGKKKISILSMGVDHVRFRIGRIPSDQLNHLISQSDGDLTSLEFNNYNFTEDNIVDNTYSTKSLTRLKPGEANYFSYDFSSYLVQHDLGTLRKGIFFFEVQEWDSNNRYARGTSDKRLIMISDLGMLTKDGPDKSHEIFVQSISTGKPIYRAKVEVIGKNGVPILTKYTDSRGHVELPTFYGFQREQTPTVYVISKGDDLTFMPVNARGRWLDYSKFDVGGIHGRSDESRLNGYLFSDRGIYRPGDTFNIGMIVKAGNWTHRLAGTPLQVTISDSRGLEVHKRQISLNSSGFEALDYKTENTSPTGIYQVNLYTMRRGQRYQLIGSTTVKIEEFLPDRLAINSHFDDIGKLAWVAPENLQASVTLRNLFGAPAVGNRLVANLKLSPGVMWFKQFRDYHFTDPMTKGKSYTETLAEQNTDVQGKAIYELDLSKYDRATYSLNLMVNAFEKEGGRNVSTESRLLVSPLKYLLGTKVNGDLNYIYRNSERILSLIAIDNALDKTLVKNLKFELMQIQQVSVLTKNANGTYAYKSVPKSIPDTSFVMDVNEEGLNYPLKTSSPGEYELIIKNAEGIQLSRIQYTVVGKGNLSRSLDKTSELEIKLNKNDFDPGEEIEIYIKAPYKGAGLITIERDKVYAFKWFKSEDNSFIEKIQLPNDMEGNGYINVAFVRASDSKDIYMSPLSYGVAPFFVSKENRMNPITIELPTEARSGEVFNIKYQTEKPGKIVVFAVDEGILQVAGYSTPDPLSHFFKKKALEVKTSQLLDLILPDFSLSDVKGAMGGGMGMDEINNNLNPFKRKQQKPVVYWSGILETDETPRTLQYKVPDYFNGTLRVMAIAVSQSTIGRFQEKAVVRNPFIISPNVPMFAAPGDSFLVSVTVSNMLRGSGAEAMQTLSISSTVQLSLQHKKFKLRVPENADTTLSFYVKTNNKPGGANLTFKVSGGEEQSTLSSYLSVRPAIPFQTWMTGGILTKDNVDVKITRKLYEDFRTLNASVSYLPVGLSKGLVSYLDGFPHGCTEQVVSQAFPYLYLKETNGFGIDDKSARSKIDYALKVLHARQYSDGKFGIWAANAHTSDFITVYAAHFITECRQAGYYVPSSLYDNALTALETMVGARKSDLKELRIQAYAVYILTKNEKLTTNRIATLINQLSKRTQLWHTDIAGAYIGSAYSLMKMHKEADRIFSDISVKIPEHTESWHFCDATTRNSQLLYLFANHAPHMLDQISAEMVSRIAKVLERGLYTTITSSYIVMGLDALAQVSGAPANDEVDISQLIGKGPAVPIPLPMGNFPSVDFSAEARELQIDNGESKPLYYQVIESGFNTELPSERISNDIELYREFRDDEGDQVTSAELGEEIFVHLKFRSLNDRYLYNIAIIDMLPAGLEAVPTSLRSNLSGSWKPEHTEIREDRLIFYGTVSPEVQEVSYSLRAINKGSFTVPPLYGESMYDRTIFGVSPQEPFVVE